MKSEIFTLVESLGGTVKEIVDPKLVGYGPDVKEYKLVNVFDKLITSLNLRAGGWLFDKETNQKDYSDIGNIGYYWLLFEQKLAGWYLKVDFVKKETSIQWLNDYDANDCDPEFGGNRYNVIYLMNNKDYELYWQLGWFAYDIWNDLDNAINYSKKCIEINNTIGLVNANLGLFYLIKGNLLSSNEQYNLAIINIKKEPEKAKKRFKATIDDINDAIDKINMESDEKSSIKGSDEILKKLQAEYDKL
jgi:tetratricopeptide (TPR) repeat protein